MTGSGSFVIETHLPTDSEGPSRVSVSSPPGRVSIRRFVTSSDVYPVLLLPYPCLLCFFSVPCSSVSVPIYPFPSSFLFFV